MHLPPSQSHSGGVSPCSSGYREDETIDCRLACGLCPVSRFSYVIPFYTFHLVDERNSSCCLIIIYIIIIVTVGVLWDWIGRLLLPPPPPSLDRQACIGFTTSPEIKRQILQYVSLRGLLSCSRIRMAWPDELWTDTHTYFNEHRFHGRRRRDHHHRHHLSSDWQRCIRSKITK